MASWNIKFSFVVMSVEWKKWWILSSVTSYISFTSWHWFIPCSVNVAFVFVRRFGIVTLLAKSNNENTPKATLVDAAVPYLVCVLRFCSSYFSCNLRWRADWWSPFSWGFNLLGIAKYFVSKSWDYGLLYGLELYVSIWTPSQSVLQLIQELANELLTDF